MVWLHPRGIYPAMSEGIQNHIIVYHSLLVIIKKFAAVFRGRKCVQSSDKSPVDGLRIYRKIIFFYQGDTLIKKN